MEAEALHDFVPSEKDTELAFSRGDKLLIFNYGDPVPWYDAQRGLERGFVPGNYIRLKRADWYMGRIPRTRAEDFLRYSAIIGNFIVRLSESSPSDFSLSVHCETNVQHFRIIRDPQKFKYYLWDLHFDSINELVEYYRKNSVSKSPNKIIMLCDMEPNRFLAEALYDFQPQEDDPDAEQELAFKQGDIIYVSDSSDENWWGGKKDDREGYFPQTYVKKLNFMAHEE